jgi:CubicO group peptidase (beta-lactamase class C family)
MAMDSASRLVAGWVQERRIPGAVLHVAVRNRYEFSQAFGAYDDNSGIKPIRLNTLFDVASLTKVTATLPAVLTLAAKERLQLNDKVSAYIPAFPHGEVTLRHLLMHSSGLPADLKTQPRAARGRQVLADICRMPLMQSPGMAVVYSDLGMILLGEIVAIASGEPLNSYVRRTVFEPLGMRDTGFLPSPEQRARAAATERVDGRYIVGAVHDEKAYHLGGVSGSAGLFTTAADLMAYAMFWLGRDRNDIVPWALLDECLANPFRGRGLGWEVYAGDPDPLPTSCGTLWSPGSFGHTGFTGTSLWIDPQRELAVVFLTNAVHYGRGNPIRALRRKLHDEIFASLFLRG